MQPFYYSRPTVDDSEVTAVTECLAGNFLSQGPMLERFERKLADYCGAQYCIAVSNGTAALHLACLALGLTHGDIGWTSALTFVASANAIRYCGAKVNFIDIEETTLNLSPQDLKQKLRQASREGILPKVLIPVHFAGQVCDMKTISQIAREYGCKIIEDACHALGGTYNGGKVGNCSNSDITVFSFHPVKSITTGEGGAILTNSAELTAKIKLLRSHGLKRASSPSDPPWQVEMQSEGFNYRLTDFQCALGICQLQKLDLFIKKRKKLAARYHYKLANMPIKFQSYIPDTESAWHLFIILIDFSCLSIGKLAFFELMRERDINLMVHYLPVPLHSFYNTLGFTKGMFTQAETYYEKAFSLPLYPNLKEEEVDYICEQLIEVINQNRKRP